MHLKCPHCQNPIEAVDNTVPANIVCPSCGSSIQLTQSTTVRMPEDGCRTLGKFVLLDMVGVGAFGSVYEARDPELDRIVAIKLPRAGNLAGGGERERFLREARSVAQLRHVSIVTVHDVGDSDGLPYLVSEFVEGITLSDWLTAHRPTHRQTAELIAQLADALDYAHSHGVTRPPM